MALPAGETLILVTHSKGTVDTLEALAKYPALADRVAAVVSVSGAVYGSPLADSMPSALIYLGHQMPLATCPPGENMEAVDSLRRSVRLAWFATHRLPARVRFYSLAAYAGPHNVSALLVAVLAQPGAKPIPPTTASWSPRTPLCPAPRCSATRTPTISPSPCRSRPSPLINRNDYPRAVLLEAAVRAVQEDLDRPTETRTRAVAKTGWRRIELTQRRTKR